MQVMDLKMPSPACNLPLAPGEHHSTRSSTASLQPLHPSTAQPLLETRLMLTTPVKKLVREG